MDAAWDIIAGGRQSYTGQSFNAFAEGAYCRQMVVNEEVTVSGITIIDAAFNDVTSDYIDTANVTTLSKNQIISFKAPIYSVGGVSSGSFTFYFMNSRVTPLGH